MIRITKTKVAGALAAGVLTLGGVGAYAANNTITVSNPQPITIGSGSDQLKLISVDGKSLSLPSSFSNHGDCVSFFATNRDFALAPATSGTSSGSVKISKDFHGKLVSKAAAWCRTSAAGVTKSSSDSDSEAASSEAAETGEAGDDSSQKSLKSGGAGQHGHGPRP